MPFYKSTQFADAEEKKVWACNNYTIVGIKLKVILNLTHRAALSRWKEIVRTKCKYYVTQVWFQHNSSARDETAAAAAAAVRQTSELSSYVSAQSGAHCVQFPAVKRLRGSVSVCAAASASKQSICSSRVISISLGSRLTFDHTLPLLTFPASSLSFPLFLQLYVYLASSLCRPSTCWSATSRRCWLLCRDRASTAWPQWSNYTNQIPRSTELSDLAPNSATPVSPHGR